VIGEGLFDELAQASVAQRLGCCWRGEVFGERDLVCGYQLQHTAGEAARRPQHLRTGRPDARSANKPSCPIDLALHARLAIGDAHGRGAPPEAAAPRDGQLAVRRSRLRH
jgi:hypothetical protein